MKLAVFLAALHQFIGIAPPSSWLEALALGQRLLAWCSTFFGVLIVYRVREEAEAKVEARRRGGAEARRRGGAEARRRAEAEMHNAIDEELSLAACSATKTSLARSLQESEARWQCVHWYRWSNPICCMSFLRATLTPLVRPMPRSSFTNSNEQH